MTEIVKTSIRINAPIEEVFEALSNHAAYGQLKSVSRARLLKKGAGHTHGVGARRELQISGLRLWEDITSYQPPYYFQYKVIRIKYFVGPFMINPPMRHYYGRIECEKEADDITLVRWTSLVEVLVPVVGGGVGMVARPRLRGMFRRILRDFKKQLEGQA